MARYSWFRRLGAARHGRGLAQECLGAGRRGHRNLLLGATTAVNHALTTQREYPVQSLLLFDVAGISVLTNHALFDAVSHQIPRIMRGQDRVSIAALRSGYYPSTWTPLVFVPDSPLAIAVSAEEVDALKSLWKITARSRLSPQLTTKSLSRG